MCTVHHQNWTEKKLHQVLINLWYGSTLLPHFPRVKFWFKNFCFFVLEAQCWERGRTYSFKESLQLSAPSKYELSLKWLILYINDVMHVRLMTHKHPIIYCEVHNSLTKVSNICQFCCTSPVSYIILSYLIRLYPKNIGSSIAVIFNIADILATLIGDFDTVHHH